MNLSPEKPLVSFRQEPTHGDVAAIEQLAKDTGFFTPAEVAVARELVEESLERGVIAGYLFVLAEINGELVGFACYGEIPATEQRYDLYWIIVSPRHQRLGIGTRILAETEAAILELGGRKIYIETSSKPLYESTRNFYLASGYEQAANLPDFYQDGDGKLIYVKSL